MSAKKHAPSSGTAGSELPFEEALERLEHIVEELEGGSLSLEDSLARYEEGIQLSRRLTQTLDEAEKRIEKLIDGEGGSQAATAAIELDLKTPESEGGEGRLPL